MNRRPYAACLAVVVFLLSAVPAAAQPDEAAEAGPARSDQAPEPVRELTAHRLAELARSMLSEPRPDHPDRLAAARTLLARATELDPDNAQLLRLRLEALRLAEDVADERRSALRRYLKLRPADDVAQLEFIGLLAENAQTAEQRLKVYERLLTGDGARQLSAPLRSRLAMRAARLHRQRGESSEYGERLKEAIRLDSTNRRACAAAYNLLQQRGTSTVELTQALLNLVAADPSDGDLHAELASMLLRCGQYEPAVNWYGSASRLWRYQGHPGPGRMIDTVRGWALALWASDQPDRAVRFIRSFDPGSNAQGDGGRPEGAEPPEQPELFERSGEADAEASSDQAEGEDSADQQGEEAADRQGGGSEAALPARVQMILVAILQNQQRMEAADEAFDRLVRTLRPPDQREAPDAEQLADFVWAHLLLNRGIDQLEPRIQRLTEELGEDDPLMVRLRGWWMLRRGDTDKARRLLQRGAEEGDFVCRYGLTQIGRAHV